jgi:hypothetical protein
LILPRHKFTVFTLFPSHFAISLEPFEPFYGEVVTVRLSRNYCEKLKRSKYVIDGFPNTKKVAMWVLEK